MPSDNRPNVGEKASVAREKTRTQLKKDREKQSWEWVLNDTKGRHVLWMILANAKIYNPSFTGNSHTFFNEGRRSIGLDLLESINSINPKGYANMMIENVNRELENK